MPAQFLSKQRADSQNQGWFRRDRWLFSNTYCTQFFLLTQQKIYLCVPHVYLYRLQAGGAMWWGTRGTCWPIAQNVGTLLGKDKIYIYPHIL